MKKLIPIYEDKETLIEMDQAFFDAYELLLTPFFRVNAFTYDLILGLAAETIVDKELASPDDLIVCSRKIYVLEENEYIRIEKPFDVFEDALANIVSTADFSNHIKELEEQINKEGKFFCEIFDKPFMDTCGYICQVKDGKITLLFFTYDY